MWMNEFLDFIWLFIYSVRMSLIYRCLFSSFHRLLTLRSYICVFDFNEVTAYMQPPGPTLLPFPKGNLCQAVTMC